MSSPCEHDEAVCVFQDWYCRRCDEEAAPEEAEPEVTKPWRPGGACPHANPYLGPGPGPFGVARFCRDCGDLLS